MVHGGRLVAQDSGLKAPGSVYCLLIKKLPTSAGILSVPLPAMKNKILYLFTFLLLSINLLAQDSDERQLSSIASVNDAADMANQIVKASGRKVNFMIAEAQVQNAVAVLHNGKRYILYNPRFMDALTRATGTKWAAISVLAHEIGHHLYGKTKNGRMMLATELEADEFSGYVLERMGATLPEAQAAMNLLATTHATATHPGRVDRVQSIAKGFKNAGGVVPEEEEDATVKTAPDRKAIFTDNGTAIIAASISFTNQPDKEYYITERMNLIRVSDSKVAIIAKVSRSDNNNYPYVIYDDTGYRLYVDRTGSIITAGGRVIGQMRSVTSSGE